jgi:methylase of polypeptide subunit release factors
MTAQLDTGETADFGGLTIHWDRRVLRPRPWTAAQSHWAAELAEECADGAILELCCGAGQIGLLAASLTGRSLVQVDRDPVAAAYARRNAAATGIDSDVRLGSYSGVLAPGEVFPLVIVDPPWVPSARVPEFPEDPVGAIDGGSDGTDQIVLSLGVSLRHLHPDGHVLVQVGGPEQVDVVRAVMAGLGTGAAPERTVLGVRDHRPGGMLVHVGPEDTGRSPG